MQQPARKTRKQKAQEPVGRVIKDKFVQDRIESVRAKPIVPMNHKQEDYLQILNEKQICIVSGLAGTSKSYLAAATAADLYKLGQIERILVTRPAISSSQSVGYTSGDFQQKMTSWLGGVIPVFKERLGSAMLELAISTEDIQYVPLETVKGLSLNNTWLIVEESSDLTKEEVIKLITRMGKNSKLVLAGDVRQSELRGESGLVWLINFLQRHSNLQKNFGWVDFDSPDYIVRSTAVKEFIISMLRDEKYSSKV